MPSSADDPLAHALRAAAVDIVAAVSATDAAHPVVLIDGRSGAGKSTVTDLLIESWPLDARPYVLRLEDVYPGWDGLDAAADAIRTGVLEVRRGGHAGRWRTWDWSAGVPAGEHVVPAGLPLIIEGCGVLTAASASLADVRVWIDAPANARRARALARDGDLFRPYWSMWAAQEERHLERDDPESLADIVITLP